MRLTTQQGPHGHAQHNNPRSFVRPLVPTRPAKSTSTMTGYPHTRTWPIDHYRGPQLQAFLQMSGINMEALPPFEIITARAGYSKNGVVKINNIPFTVTAQEIVHFINRYTGPAPMLKKNVEGCPLHIIMEKPTGKTMDCFVEFSSHEAARDCVTRFEYTALPGRGTKIGSRNVTLDLSDQAELMRAIFPRARLVKFDAITGKPQILDRGTDPSWSAGFRGYFTLEEIYGVTKFAENPSRSPFVQKVNQRPYECLISTLYKFPWAEVQTYTVAARNCLWQAAYTHLEILTRRVGPPSVPNNTDAVAAYQFSYQNHIPPLSDVPTFVSGRRHSEPPIMEREVGISQSLLFDVLFAALNVPAFSPLQKWGLCQIAGPYGLGVPLTKLASCWPFQTICPRDDVPEHVAKFWLELLHSGWELMSANGIPTTYEHYISFNLNKIGFLVAEWTIPGVQLPFKDAIRIEKNVMLLYINCGRVQWAREKKLTITNWSVDELSDVLQDIARETAAGRHFEPDQQGNDSQENDVSPTTTGLDQQTVVTARHGKNENVMYSSTGQIPEFQEQQSTNSDLNASTMVEFVPSTIQSTGLNYDTSSSVDQYKNIWAFPHSEQDQIKLPAQDRESRSTNLYVNTNMTNTDGQAGGFSQYTASDPSISAPFRDPFGPPSNQYQGFKPDSRKSFGEQDLSISQPWASRYPSSSSPRSFNPFQRKMSIQAQKQPTYPPSSYSNSPAHDPSLGMRRDSVPNPMSQQMRKLSLAGAKNSSFSDYTSYSPSVQQRTPSTSTAISSPKRGFSIDERGSPTPRQMEKYPNLTYSTTSRQPQQQSLAQTQGLPPFGSFTPQGSSSRTGSETTTSFIQSPSFSAERLRARSIPITAVGRGTLINVTTNAGPGAVGDRAGGQKRGSLPVDASMANTAAAANFVGAPNTTFNQATNRKDSAKSQLGSQELWNEVRGSY